MARPRPYWGILFFILLLLTTLAAAYFAWQLRRSAPSPPANFLGADKGYGVTLDLTRYPDDALAETLAQLQENGLIWLRQPITWAELEPSPGQLEWQSLDRIIGQVANLPDKMNLILVLHTTPAWARPADTPPTTPPTEVSDFGNFARALATRYGERVDAYQIWHEPNLSANWGNAYVDSSAYADLLREAALNIRAADPQAIILNAALAPTLENGPLNLNELGYLERLYQAKANRWFDAVAVQPYGFDAEPSDPPAADRLNFRRAELLRQVMLTYGDAATPLWATAFGWNALPADWSGQPSPWHSDTPEIQAHRTAEAITLARREWPWLGPLLAPRWAAADLPPDDPARGFALRENPPLLAAIKTAATADPVATAGNYPASHPTGHYSSGWRLAQTQADIPRHEPRTLTISFEGTRLDLSVNRGLFRGYLWVTIDGQPANALPQDSHGRSYVVLYDPLRGGESVTLARNLPFGPHQAVIEAEGGWGQWAIAGWAVYNEANSGLTQTWLAVAGMFAILSGLAWVVLVLRTPGQFLKMVWAWGEILLALYAILGERGQIVATFALALAFYLAPGWAGVALLLPLILAILLRPDLGLALVAFSLSFFQAAKQLPLGRFSPVELALALTVLGFIFRGWLSWGRARYAEGQENIAQLEMARSQFSISNLQSLDWATFALLALALMATFAAQNFGVSLREWRVVVLESVIFYFLVRLGLDFKPQLPALTALRTGDRRPETGDHRNLPALQPSNPPIFQSSNPSTSLRIGLPALQPSWVFRLINAFLAGAVLQAMIALYLYFFTDQSITAEGVRRAMGLAYGSPNNLALFLDRSWPILLALTIWSVNTGNVRELEGTEGTLSASSLSSPQFPPVPRWLYGLGLLIVSVALFLTFSKGALFLGLPVGMVVMAILMTSASRKLQASGKLKTWPAKRVVMAVVVTVAIIGLALIPLSQTERFRTTFDLRQGSTGFFRVKLWEASLAMLRDHWPLGVGLDNFLYQYRTRYILPEAWQEPNLSHPHNLILDFGTRLGVGGIAILLWLQLAFWRSAVRLYRRRPDPLVLGLMGSMAVILVHGLVDHSYFLVDLAFVFFLIVGVIQRLWEE
ncbi:MAG: O-antigen ligase family protein [Anaerolineae bacterium]